MKLRMLMAVLSCCMYLVTPSAAGEPSKNDTSHLTVTEDPKKGQLQIEYKSPYSALYPKRVTTKRYGAMLLVKLHLGLAGGKNVKVLPQPFTVEVPPEVNSVVFQDKKNVIWMRKNKCEPDEAQPSPGATSQ